MKEHSSKNNKEHKKTKEIHRKPRERKSNTGREEGKCVSIKDIEPGVNQEEMVKIMKC